MEESMLVSLIIPVYNASKELNRCLDSVLAQTYRELEVICVDDASTDDSSKILSQYSKQDERFCVYTHSINRNAGGARNTAIAHAHGDYIFFIDSDDWLKNNAIELLINATEGGKFDIVSSPLTDYEEDGTTRREDHMFPCVDKAQIIEYMMLNGLRMLGGVIRRTIFTSNNIKYPENVFFEDNAIGQVPFVLAKSIKVIEDSVYCYKNWGESSSRSFSRQRIVDRIMTTKMIIDNAKKYGFYDNYKSLVDYRYLFLSVWTIELVAELPYFDARKLIKDVETGIKSILPNPYFDRLQSAERKIINSHYVYLNLRHMYRINQSIRMYLHKIRHSIVAQIKKFVGMNPNKSIFQKK